MTSEKKQRNAEDPKEKALIFTPMGSDAPIELSVALARRYLAKPTKNGGIPDDVDIIKFLKLCESNRLNPWVGDAMMIGYDEQIWGSNQTRPVFSMIVAAQALFKRAELSPAFDGIESGVVVVNKAGEKIYREGDLVFTEDDEEKLIGGWARVYRNDRTKVFYDALKLTVYTTNKARWLKDPAGLIVKCAESSALRKALPNVAGGLYTREEMDHVLEGTVASAEPGAAARPEQSGPSMGSALDELSQKLQAEQPHNQTPRQQTPPQQTQRLSHREESELDAAVRTVVSGGARESRQVEKAKTTNGQRTTVDALKAQIAELPEPEMVTAAPDPTTAYRRKIEGATSREELSDLIWDIDSDPTLDEDQRTLLVRVCRSAEGQFSD